MFQKSICDKGEISIIKIFKFFEIINLKIYKILKLKIEIFRNFINFDFKQFHFPE